MRFEELAREAGMELAESADRLRPPEFGIVVSRRRRAGAVGGVVVALVMACLLVTALFLSVRPDSDPMVAGSAAPETEMTVDLLDGSSVEIASPVELHLSGFQTWVERAELGGAVGVYVSPVDDPAEMAGVEEAEFERTLSEGVALWRGDREGQPIFMSVDMEGWVVFLNVGYGTAPGTDFLLGLADDLRGVPTGEGVVLPNLEADSFTVLFGASVDQSIHVVAGNCRREMVPGSESVTHSVRGEVIRVDGYASWCDSSSDLEVLVFGDEDFVEQVLDGLIVDRTGPAPLPPTTLAVATTASSTPITETSTTPLASPFPAAITPVDDLGWEAVEIPAGVAAWNETMVWTGSELVFWGGEDETSTGRPEGEPGMAYDPASRSWRYMAASPLPATFGATGVWTGEVVLVCCGSDSRQLGAYDPATDSWRRLADGPLEGDFAESVWTGEAMLVVTQSGVAAYHPADDTWVEHSAPPLDLGRTNEVAWTGTELLVWPSTVTRQVYPGMLLNPFNDEWTILPDPPAWPAAVEIAWTGDDLIIWGGLPAESAGSEGAVGSRYDPTSNEWTELPEPLPEPEPCECNLGSQALLWTGEAMIVSTGHFGSAVNQTRPLLLSYQPDNHTWYLVEEAPFDPFTKGIVAGDRVVFRSDLLYVSPPGWQPAGQPIPAEGLQGR